MTINLNNHRVPDRHRRWAQFRTEKEQKYRRRYGGSDWRRDPFGSMVWLLSWAIRLTGFYKRGLRNALNITLKTMEMSSPDLPRAFDGYRILHISDLHLDFFPDVGKALIDALSSVEAELCVFTGDFQGRFFGDVHHTMKDLTPVLSSIRAQDGILSVLGNHDSIRLLAPLEEEGVVVLVNETLTLHREEDTIQITGLDDVHDFYTEMAVEALQESLAPYKILLVHSPHFARRAAIEGFHLYLCGHTHGGQISLPGNIPVATRMKGNRAYASGYWRIEKMRGLTSNGVGVSILPLRFNAPSEIHLITLKRRP
jgi:hypothetical protein|tara:strand:+ start:49 stop:984 length:936 start_codon:yes stop_codon:yes gene_type:complete